MNRDMGKASNLSCSKCNRTFAPDRLLNLCECGHPLLVNYELQALRSQWQKGALKGAVNSRWRYAPVLPAEHGEAVTLQEAWTPLISDCGRLVAERKQREGWFEVSTLKEPYRIEGKKTMGYEVAEQFEWQLPDAILYPCGGGVGLIGMWKAFVELEQLGWMGSKRPKLIAVQATGCEPITRAFQQNAESSEFFEDAHTVASG